jgi:hypothetical protein
MYFWITGILFFLNADFFPPDLFYLISAPFYIRLRISFAPLVFVFFAHSLLTPDLARDRFAVKNELLFSCI